MKPLNKPEDGLTPSRYDRLIDALIYGNGGVGKCNCETCSARREAAESIRDLISALQAIAQRANESGTGELGERETIYAMHALARAAIAKAKGE